MSRVFRLWRRSLSDNTDFFSTLKKRLNEEAKKENKDFSELTKTEYFRNLKNNYADFVYNLKRVRDNSKLAYNKFSNRIITAKSRIHHRLEFLTKNDHVSPHLKSAYEFYRARKPTISSDNQFFRAAAYLYNQGIGDFIRTAPKPFTNTEAAKKLLNYTQVLEQNTPVISEKTVIVFRERKGLDWLINDYIKNIGWINRTLFYIRHTDNKVARAVFDSYANTSRMLGKAFSDQQSINAHKQLLLIMSDFDKQSFIYEWENKVIPGLLDAFCFAKDFDLIKTWTTPDAYEQLVSMRTFLDASNVVPVILDIYDCDVVEVKMDAKTGAGSLSVRFNAIHNFKTLVSEENEGVEQSEGEQKEEGKKYEVFSPNGFKESSFTWEVKIDANYAGSNLAFKVSDFSFTVPFLYGIV